jgi:hypothetical protein
VRTRCNVRTTLPTHSTTPATRTLLKMTAKHCTLFCTEIALLCLQAQRLHAPLGLCAAQSTPNLCYSKHARATAQTTQHDKHSCVCIYCRERSCNAAAGASNQLLQTYASAHQRACAHLGTPVAAEGCESRCISACNRLRHWQSTALQHTQPP